MRDHRQIWPWLANGPNGRIQGFVEVGIIKDDRGDLSMKFEGELLNLGAAAANGRAGGGPHGKEMARTWWWSTMA